MDGYYKDEDGIIFEAFRCDECEFSEWDEENYQRISCECSTEEECYNQYRDAEWM